MATIFTCLRLESAETVTEDNILKFMTGNRDKQLMYDKNHSIWNYLHYLEMHYCNVMV